jgi:type II secretory pathway component PulF
MISRHRAWVLRMLAAAFAQGKTVAGALGQLTGGWSAYPSPFVRRRLAATQRLVEAGHPWQEALLRSRLVAPSDVAVLTAAQEAGNLPWAMRMLADRKMRLTAFRWSIVQQIVFTIIVLAFGLFVLWVGVAMIIPLADLVENLSM